MSHGYKGISLAKVAMPTFDLLHEAKLKSCDSSAGRATLDEREL